IKGWRDPIEHVRREALNGLLELPANIAIPAAIDASVDQEPGIRRRAVQYLAAISQGLAQKISHVEASKIAQALRPKLNDRFADLPAVAVSAAVWKNEPDGMDILSCALEDRARGVRSAALRSIAFMLRDADQSLRDLIVSRFYQQTIRLLGKPGTVKSAATAI